MTIAEWHSTLFQFIGLIISALTLIGSIFAVIFTYKNLKEMKKQLAEQQYQYLEQNRGNLVFYISGNATSTSYSLILKNFGNSPAKLLSIKIDPELSWKKIGKPNLEQFNISNLKNVFLAPKQSICSTFWFDNYPDKEFSVKLVYETCGNTYTEEYSINLNFQNIVLNSKPDIQNELSALKHINDSISSLAEKIT